MLVRRRGKTKACGGGLSTMLVVNLAIIYYGLVFVGFDGGLIVRLSHLHIQWGGGGGGVIPWQSEFCDASCCVVNDVIFDILTYSLMQ